MTSWLGHSSYGLMYDFDTFALLSGCNTLVVIIASLTWSSATLYLYQVWNYDNATMFRILRILQMLNGWPGFTSWSTILSFRNGLTSCMNWEFCNLAKTWMEYYVPPCCDETYFRYKIWNRKNCSKRFVLVMILVMSWMFRMLISYLELIRLYLFVCTLMLSILQVSFIQNFTHTLSFPIGHGMHHSFAKHLCLLSLVELFIVTHHYIVEKKDWKQQSYTW